MYPSVWLACYSGSDGFQCSVSSEKLQASDEFYVTDTDSVVIQVAVKTLGKIKHSAVFLLILLGVTMLSLQRIVMCKFEYL